MTRLSRQLYLGTILVCSLVGLPMVLLYSSGYRINIRSLSIEETGSLIVSSFPKDTTLSILEEGISDVTPSIVNQLAPGEYTVKITKDGYMPWQDTVLIQPKRSTIIDTVLLFKNEPASQVIESYPKNIFPKVSTEKIQNFSPDIQYALSQLHLSEDLLVQSEDMPVIVVLDQNSGELYVIDENGPNVQAQTLGNNIVGFEWNDELQGLLLHSQYEISLYQVEAKYTRSIIRQSEPIREAFWHPRANYIIYTSGPYIRAIETRLTDNPNTTTLYYGSEPSQVRTDKKGTLLYLTESTGERFAITIQ